MEKWPPDSNLTRHLKFQKNHIDCTSIENSKDDQMLIGQKVNERLAKKVCILLSFCILLYGLNKISQKKFSPFDSSTFEHSQGLSLKSQVHPVLSSTDLASLVDQPFYFQGRHKEFYVFQSEDNRFLLHLVPNKGKSRRKHKKPYLKTESFAETVFNSYKNLYEDYRN